MKNKSKAIIVFFGIIFLIGLNQLNAQMSLEWVSQISGSGRTILASGAAVDKAENVFAVGSFKDSIEVTTINGPVKLISKGEEDMFIAKINPAGKLVWIEQVGGKAGMGSNGAADLAMNDYFSIVTDAEDNLYITGNYEDTVDFDPGPGTALKTTPLHPGGAFPGQPIPMIPYTNSFILKLNNNGEFIWVRTLYGNNNSSAGIALDPDEGTICITGYFQDSVDFNQQKQTTVLRSLTKGKKDVFVTKYDTAGNFVWVKQMGGCAGNNQGLDINIDTKGNIYTTGIFYDSADFDPGAGTAYLISTSKPGQNVFVSKLDRNGNYIWAKAMGSISQGAGARASGIATDPAGNVYTTGYFQGMASFDPTNQSVITTNGNLTCFISKLDASGNYGWVRTFERLPGKYGPDNGLSIKTDKNGAVYAAGYFMGESYFDADPAHASREVFKSSSSPDAFVLKLDAGGNYIWGRQVSSDRHSRGLNVLVAPSGNVYLSGYFSGTTDFNPSGRPYDLTAFNSSDMDGFVMKLFCSDTSGSALTIEDCGKTFELNGAVYTQSGIYTQTYINASGCDSTLTLNLTLDSISRPLINVNGFILGTTIIYSSYQWLLNGNIIPGAVNRSYTVVQNGVYRVVVSNEKGCTDTSAEYTVSNYTAIEDLSTIARQIKIYPNPSDNRIFIQSPVKVNVVLTSITGRLIRSVINTYSISIKDLAAGLYLLRITDQNGMLIKVEKVLKSR